MFKIIKFNMNICCVCECKFNTVYKIEKIGLIKEELKKQLNNFGFIKNEELVVLKTNYGKSSFLIEVMNVKYALDKKICEQIFVKEMT